MTCASSVGTLRNASSACLALGDVLQDDGKDLLARKIEL